ncbi:MAG: translation elongation factor Ts [Rhodospirillales bacterium]|nr:translation elongation factor Ts [Rhodospirillales bacterium]
MAQITAALVKDLREKSGAGMMDCKKALTECDGDVENAIDWLRQKGLASAAKKSGRVAAEGLVGFAAEGNKGVVIELNAETDFVSRNEAFQDMVSGVANVALSNDGDFDKTKVAAFPGSDKNVEEFITEMVGSIGENMNLRRTGGLSVNSGVVSAYMHGALKPGLGKIGVLVAVESDGDVDKLAALGKQVAMHVAATNPESLDRDSLPQEVIDRERNVLIEQAKASGKPQEIAEKMVEGRIRKFYQEVCLLEQDFVMDTDKTVGKAVEEAAKDIGSDVKVTGFLRFALGDGIEKQEEDYAAEVAAMAGV